MESSFVAAAVPCYRSNLALHSGDHFCFDASNKNDPRQLLDLNGSNKSRIRV